MRLPEWIAGYFVREGTTRRETVVFDGWPRPGPGASFPAVRVPGSEQVYRVGTWAWAMPLLFVGGSVYPLRLGWSSRPI